MSEKQISNSRKIDRGEFTTCCRKRTKEDLSALKSKAFVIVNLRWMTSDLLRKNTLITETEDTHCVSSLISTLIFFVCVVVESAGWGQQEWDEEKV